MPRDRIAIWATLLLITPAWSQSTQHPPAQSSTQAEPIERGWLWAADDIVSDPSCVVPIGDVTVCFAAGKSQKIIKLTASRGGVSEQVWDHKAIASAPNCVMLAEYRDDCFAADDQGRLVHGFKIAAEQVQWETLGGEITGRPTCVSTGADKIDCFVRRDDIFLRHIAWRDGHWGKWSENLDVTSLTSDLSCVAGADDRIECFARGKNRGLWRMSWDGKRIATSNLHGVIQEGTRPECLSWGPGRIDCFAQGDASSGNALLHIAANNGSWAKWDPGVGGLDKRSNISCLSRAKEQLDCFMGGGIPQIYHRGWRATGWTGWKELGGWPNTPTCISSDPDRMDCFVRGPKDALYYKYWDGEGWHPQTAEQAKGGR